MPEVRTFHFNDAQTKRDGTSSHLCIHCWNWDYSFSSRGKCGRIVNFLFGLISFWEGQYWTWEWACPCWWWPCPSARPWRRCCRSRWCSPCWCTVWIPACPAPWPPGDIWMSSPLASLADFSAVLTDQHPATTVIATNTTTLKSLDWVQLNYAAFSTGFLLQLFLSLCVFLNWWQDVP